MTRMISSRVGVAPPLIAVCVCTRSRPQMVRRCLASLQRQHFDPAHLRMQIFLVDNNPEPTTLQAYHEFCTAERMGGFVHCPQPGIPNARNAALGAALRAGADYIAFLDDDEVAPQHWLRSLLQALEVSGADAVQGGVCKRSGNVESIAVHAAAPEGLSWQESESLATSNVLFKARLVARPLSLRFDESMQFTGGSDREFFMRAHKHGATLLRVYGIDVFEEVAEGRESFAYECCRAFAAGSNYLVRISKNEPAPVATARIALRVLERGFSGLVKLGGAAALTLALQRRSAQRQWRNGCVNLCFAAGCLTPLVGVRAYPYRIIRGA